MIVLSRKRFNCRELALERRKALSIFLVGKISHINQSKPSHAERIGRGDDASKLFRFLLIQSESYEFLVPSFRLWKKGHTSLLDLTLYPLINLIGCSFFFFFSTHKSTHHQILIFTVMMAVTTEATKMTA